MQNSKNNVNIYSTQTAYRETTNQNDVRSGGGMLVQNSSSNIYATQGVINRSSGPVNQQAFDTNSMHNSQLRDSLQSSGGFVGMDSGISPNTVMH